MGTDNPAEPRHDDASLAHVVDLSSNTLQSVLASVAEQAVARTSGDAASITLMVGAKPTTFASTGEVAGYLDETQYRQGYGPCLDAVLSAEPVLVADSRTEERWPKFSPVAVEQGVLSSLSMPVPVLESVAASLNVYATSARAFAEPDREALQQLIGRASAALANVYLYDASRTLVEQMQTAAMSRVVIDQARGILMQMHRCTAEEAFDILRRTSQHSNRKIRDIAQQIVDQVGDDKRA